MIDLELIKNRGKDYCSIITVLTFGLLVGTSCKKDKGEDATIAGIVTDGITGLPVKNVTVRVLSDEIFGVYNASQFEKEEASTITQSDGSYSLSYYKEHYRSYAAHFYTSSPKYYSDNQTTRISGVNDLDLNFIMTPASWIQVLADKVLANYDSVYFDYPVIKITSDTIFYSKYPYDPRQNLILYWRSFKNGVETAKIQSVEAPPFDTILVELK